MNMNWISLEFLTRIDKKRAIFAAAVIAPASLRPSQAVKLITSTEWIFPHLSFAKYKEKPLPDGRGFIIAAAFPLLGLSVNRICAASYFSLKTDGRTVISGALSLEKGMPMTEPRVGTSVSAVTLKNSMASVPV